MFCRITDLKNESDVEQKFLFPLLTSHSPAGLGFPPSEIFTKPHLKSLVIDKGSKSKVYFPDYAVVISGIPVAILEVKSPSDTDLEEAFREARLYSHELNAQFPHGANPCQIVIATNGTTLLCGYTDSAEVAVKLTFDEVTAAAEAFSRFTDIAARQALHASVTKMQAAITSRETWRAVNLLGGISVRNEEVGYNSVGTQLTIDFSHLFAPVTRQQRVHIVRNGYITSIRRERYIDEIDRVLGASLAPILRGVESIKDPSDPASLIAAFRKSRSFESPLFLLVGPVGCGKSSFALYFQETKLPQDLRASTLWVNVDFNDAPPARESSAALDEWVFGRIASQLESSASELNLQDYALLEKVFAVEINKLKRGPLALHPPGSDWYNQTLSTELTRLMNSPPTYAKCLARFLCSERSRKLVIVFDNCDKGDPQEQLHVFQTVRYIQTFIPCIAFLPIRDITFDLHSRKPPLDTVLKQFVFRIETPSFTAILGRRLQLAMDELSSSITSSERYEYELDSGMRVVYPAGELGEYLACIFRSIYEHDRILRRMIVGLAGRDVRKAMELFLDFCKSGHITQKELLKIRLKRGQHSLPLDVIIRVLLRQNRRFYDGDRSIVKNLFQADPSERRLDHLIRLELLLQLRARFKKPGPTNMNGFHPASVLIEAVVAKGFDSQRTLRELKYLVDAKCITTEHLRSDLLSEADLICISPVGFSHLDLSDRSDYLAACAEDSFVSSRDLAESVKNRIGSGGDRRHFSRESTRRNAEEFLQYLSKEVKAREEIEGAAWQDGASAAGKQIVGCAIETKLRFEIERKREGWPEIETLRDNASATPGNVEKIKAFGVLVRIGRFVGMAHVSKIAPTRELSSFTIGEEVSVKVLAVDSESKRIELEIL